MLGWNFPFKVMRFCFLIQPVIMKDGVPRKSIPVSPKVRKSLVVFTSSHWFAWASLSWKKLINQSEFESKCDDIWGRLFILTGRCQSNLIKPHLPILHEAHCMLYRLYRGKLWYLILGCKNETYLTWFDLTQSLKAFKNFKPLMNNN